MSVMFRETVRRPAEGESKWIRNLGPKYDYAHVHILLEPGERGSGIQLAPINEMFFPAEYFPGVEQGLMSALASGTVARGEVTDVKATVINGSYHDVDSSIHAFSRATEEAVRQALKAADPYLLEPVAKVEVTVGEEFFGMAIAAMNSHRGRIDEVKVPGVIVASIPELELADFKQTLASAVQPPADCKLLTIGFDELPRSIAERLRFCPGCERKVLPRLNDARCPDCGSALDSGGDFSTAV